MSYDLATDTTNITHRRTDFADNTYPVLIFQGDEKRHWYENLDYETKTDSVPEVFHSKLGQLIGAPVVQNDFAKVLYCDGTHEHLAASKVVHEDGYEYGEPWDMFGREVIENSPHLYQHCLNSLQEKVYISTFKLNKVIEELFRETTPQFKDDFVNFYLFSEFIRNADHKGLNNVPIWTPAGNPRDVASYKMAPALDFEDTLTYSAAEHNAKEPNEESLAKMFAEPVQPQNMAWATENHLDVVRGFMNMLDAVGTSEFDALTQFENVAEFFDEPNRAPAIGDALNHGFKLRAKAFQDQYSRLSK